MVQKKLNEFLGVITAIEEVATDIYKYTIYVGEAPAPDLCYAIRLGVPGRGVTRPFSPVKYKNSLVECIIKIYPCDAGKEDSMFTPNLRKLLVGAELTVLWYTPKYSIAQILRSECPPVCMISAGTGITPMLQILQHASDTKSRCAFFLINVCESSQHNILGRHKGEYGSLDVSLQSNFTDGKDRAYVLENLKNMILDRHEKRPQKDTIYLVCGPDSFVSALAGERKGAYGGILMQLGVPEAQCFKF
ncbi:cytochrome-b5 reductase [Nematocida major]|uniref:cytochrome-b5 reductase n=1 Tax=Nematocida major TaxID=1912982 RepID=UPI002008A470|nr:cytochrome-b5 reductase [Nematocida major]KAH9385234.1 cytochrome-b5 reductase [Nematocida major]